MIKQNKIKIKPVVGMISLVGIHAENFPLSFGNYFSFDEPFIKCVNMWAENLEEWVRINGGDKIEVIVFQDSHNLPFCFVTDDRIHEDWLLKDKICITGCGSITSLMYKALLDFKGLSHENNICGCEEDNQEVSLIGMWGQGKGKSHRCIHCKREWEEK